MRLIVFLYLRFRHSRIKPLVHILLLITVLQQRPPVVLQLLVHVLLAFRQFLLGHINERHVRRPRIDVLERQPRTVLRARRIRNIRIQVRRIQLVIADFGHHAPVMNKRRNRLARIQPRQDDY